MRLFNKLLLINIAAQLTTVAIVGVIMQWVLPPPHHLPPLSPPDFPPPEPDIWHWLLGPALLPTIVGSAVGLLAAWLLTIWLSRPILSLHHSMSEIAQGRLDHRIADQFSSRGDEFSDLAASHDAMADRVVGMLRHQQSLLYEISHELRSPLTRINLHLNHARDGLALDFLGVDAELERMNKLLEELLLRSRLQTQLGTSRFFLVDVMEVMDHVMSDVAIECRNKGCVIVKEGEVNVPMLGDAQLLHRAFENVLRNAIKFSPVNGTINVLIGLSEQAIDITIIDEGTGVDADKLAHIFEPFVTRVDASHHGVGLGLAITRNIITQHQGQIWAENRTPKGFQVRMRLPYTKA